MRAEVDKARANLQAHLADVAAKKASTGVLNNLSSGRFDRAAFEDLAERLETDTKTPADVQRLREEAFTSPQLPAEVAKALDDLDSESEDNEDLPQWTKCMARDRDELTKVVLVSTVPEQAGWGGCFCMRSSLPCKSPS